MKLPKEIESNIWVKNWSGNWRIAFTSLYGLYTTELKSYIGKNLNINLLVSEKTSSSNYIAKEDIDAYGHYVANLIIKDHDLAEKLAKDTVTSAEELSRFLDMCENKSSYTEASLLKIENLFYAHIPPHFSLKKVIDYLPEDLQKKFSPMLVEARLKTENLFNQVDRVLRSYAKIISEEINYPTDLIEFLTIDEIKTFLQNKVLPNKNELSERSNGMIIFCKEGTKTIFSGNEYLQVQNILVDTTKTELKGNIGYRGIAIGKARIVFDPFKVERFDEGDILITGMTRPEFLPLMQKASAFVTDAGGMLSHAAIIARELGKPCILATENATKIIKDGDHIEVDANKGTVKIIKRYKTPLSK